jgi:beta-glucanase (GH16 family)
MIGVKSTRDNGLNCLARTTKNRRSISPTGRKIVENIVLMLGAVLLLNCTGGCKSNSEGIASVVPTDSIPQLPGWTLVWNDEFSGSSIDLNKWEYEVNGNGGGNNELQYYTANPSNSYIEDGSLVIRAVKENYLGKQYTSARMRTLHKGDWKYGHIEVRAKLPYGQGLWPAIWMLPTDPSTGWPTSGEIDIMELLGHDPWTIYGTIHFAQSGQHQQMGGNYKLRSDSSFAAGFHVFAIEWDSTSIQWLIDGTRYFSANKGAPFDGKFHLLLNVAVGGNWPGSPNEFTIFPQMMIVDYVRVYQRR